MIQALKWIVRFCCHALIVAGAVLRLSAAENSSSGNPAFTETNVEQLLALMAGTNCCRVSVNLEGEVLWADMARDELFLQTAGDVLHVKVNLYGCPPLKIGQHVRLTGFGTAGEGFLDDALVDNDGLHSAQEKSASACLTNGFHPIRIDWFNGLADSVLTVEYAGPNMKRQAVPDDALFRKDASGDTNQWLPGLNYRCYQGEWEQLPHWENAMPFKTGSVTNFDVSVRTQNQEAGLEFTGYLQVKQNGLYTFWVNSDDGGRLFIGDSSLQLKVLETSSLPTPRNVRPGQALKEKDDCFWAAAEGIVTAIHVGPDGVLELELTAGKSRMYLEVNANDLQPPELFSHIRVTGLCCGTRAANGDWIAGRLLLSGENQIEKLDSPASSPIATSLPITTLADLRKLADTGQRTTCPLCLTGMVLTETSPQGFFAFQDNTGGVLVQMNHYSHPIEPGQKITLTGNGSLDGNKLYFSCPAIVDNNGVHPRHEESGATFLTAGRHPIHVSWFNRVNSSFLEIYYQGSGVKRQKIPAGGLIRPEVDATTGAVKWIQGLNYSLYQGDWQSVPAVSKLKPVETGTTNNFDIHVKKQMEKMALEFDGYLTIPKSGEYFFTLVSDDGSLLFIDEQAPQIRLMGANNPPAPLSIAPRQILAPDQNDHWSEVSGVVSFAYEHLGRLFLELNSDYGPIRIEVADGSGGSPALLLGGRVTVRGFCQSGLVSSGQGVAANLYTPGVAQIQLIRPLAAQWNRYPLEAIGDVISTNVSQETIFHIQGNAGYDSRHRLTVADSSGAIAVELLSSLQTNLTGIVEVLGRLNRSDTNIDLQSGICRAEKNLTDEDTNQLPLLTTTLQVKQLTREQAQRGYPVKIHGVITLVRGTGSGFIIQDDTSAIDVWWPPYSSTSLPRIGDEWEVEGNTFAEFSPNIRISRARRLGVGAMPEPLHPAWDQLLNGSLDTRYVELQGIVTATDAEGVTLFLPGGKIRVLLSPLPSTSLSEYQNALVRIRGCVVPIRNDVSHQVQVGQIRLSSMSLTVDEPAPSNPFDAVLKNPSDLLLFDARAGSLQRVKIAGQVLHAHGSQFYVVDGTNAIRVLSQTRTNLRAGDLAEAVGFPELGGPSPVLRESIIRKTGSAPLPAPDEIADDSLFSHGHDGTLVSVKARLVGVSGSPWEKMLEMRIGNREFAARLDNYAGALMDLLPGSLLKLTGVYSEQDNGQSAGQPLPSFELLLNSPLSIKVLERPPWWTLPRALIFSGIMAVIILATIFWIVLLRRKVEQHAAQLALEIRHREEIQRQNLLEKERTRIAKDMHDQLGTNVTQVGLLAELTRKNVGDPAKTAATAERISHTAFELGRTLDEIVWAVNPKNDSLNKFCDYIAVQAQELFQLTPILCRVDLPPEMPGHPLSAEVRHHLFLATKEALNNVVRHSNAGEVWVRFKLESSNFQISISDDGKGFTPEQKHSMRNGLQNMRKRLEDVDGHFTITSRPEHGTEVTLVISLNHAQNSQPA